MREILWLAPSPTPTPAPALVAEGLSANDILTASIAIFTLLGIIGSIWIARRGQNQDREFATAEANRAERAQEAGEASAKRAEAAAALNIDALTRIAEALERPISSALERTAEATAKRADVPLGGSGHFLLANPARVKWSLEHSAGDTYKLENIGDAEAHNVRLTSHESLMHPREWPAPERMRPGEALTFMAARTMGTVDSTITVTWNPTEDSEEEDVWRYPLPPRPPRIIR